MRVRILFYGVLSLLLGIAVAAPAGADTITFRDRPDALAGTLTDMKRVTVDHRARRLVVRARAGVLQADRPFLWIDTRRASRGPEFRMSMIPDSDGIVLRRAGGWGHLGSVVRCRALDGVASPGRRRVVFEIPRSCLKDPARVRVAVQIRFAMANRILNDWAPGTRRLSGWVRR